jgi:hypothetical protein
VIQVWVRSAGSGADQEAWTGTDLLSVSSAPVTALSVTPSTPWPIAPGTNVTWTALAKGGTTPLHYKFYGWSASGGWSLLRDYGPSPTATWTLGTGQHQLQVWVREEGSTADYQSWIGTGTFNVAATTPSVVSLTSNQTFPLPANTTITWTAVATGGSAPLQYQFWRYSYGSGTWQVVQAWSASSVYSWTPAPGDAGDYLLQVWVRSGGAGDWQAFGSFPQFTIQP